LTGGVAALNRRLISAIPTGMEIDAPAYDPERDHSTDPGRDHKN
jgi:hypothetical protein